jgi:uncharacterized protein YdeI (YjbR/CyaY-like superfamily)
MKMEITNSLYLTERKQWREWLSKNHDKETEVWLILPKKASGKQRLPYSDSVEEALCFGWIDSIVKRLDDDNNVQRFTPRRPGSGYSQPNKERLRLLVKKSKVISSVLQSVESILDEEFVYPEDIVQALKSEEGAWDNFNKFSEPYKRIRVSYVNSARGRPEEFKKRLSNLVRKTSVNKQFGYGIQKFY